MDDTGVRFLMQRAAVTACLAIIVLFLAAAVLIALLPDQPDMGGWVSVNGETEEWLNKGATDGPKPSGDGQDGKEAGEPMADSGDAEAGGESGEASVININRASAEELDALPGIGPAKARAIIEYRETYGEFETPEQLMEVKGIGPKTFERLKDQIEL